MKIISIDNIIKVLAGVSRGRGQPISIASVAHRCGIPIESLYKLTREMARNGILSISSGRGGGARIIPDATLANIFKCAFPEIFWDEGNSTLVGQKIAKTLYSELNILKENLEDINIIELVETVR